MMDPVELTGEPSKRYGKLTALDDVSLRVRRASAGAGRPQRRRQEHADQAAAGLIRPRRARCGRWAPIPPAARRRVRRSIGFLPENVGFNGAMTGRESVGFYR